ncbi:MAG TPA: helix-turn-helix transcriptional regulator [Solirubrobacterales bacterium]|nr:helix-turn-helix transcriptional regulator [Solirubrobacterales bacterium]
MDDGVGNKLREARARRKLSLQEVEEATRIRGRYLQAIEDEDWEQLPGETYARAFVRTYADFVGLDGARLAEEQRQAQGAARPGERLPRVDPRPRRVGRRRRRRVPPRLVTALVVVLVIGALIGIALAGGGGGGEPSTSSGPSLGQAQAVAPANASGAPRPGPSDHSLGLLATGEVWVCLLGGDGTPLIAGAILEPGDAEGPFRSGSFTLALGNGAIEMTVDGKERNLPESSSPIGFEVDPRGSVRELPEGERPTCT